jgi:site-specific DNA-adenine methylase
MTTRTYTDKNGNEWSWDETTELLELLKQLHQSKSQVNESVSSNGQLNPLV